MIFGKWIIAGPSADPTQEPRTRNEIWRSIPGRDGYEVSNLGRVRSVDRVVTRRLRSGRIVYANLKGRELKRHKLSIGAEL